MPQGFFLKIAENIKIVLSKRSFTQVFLYAPTGSELPLLDLFAERKIDFDSHIFLGLPVVDPIHKSMAFFKYDLSSKLEKNSYGIAEPDPSSALPLSLNQHTLVLLPALAVDQQGYRLGYGGGYYDRYLASYKDQDPVTCVVCMSDLHVEAALPREPWDIPAKYVVSDKGVFRINTDQSVDRF